MLDAASAGEVRFFAGTDSAPHSKDAKEAACGCAGIYSARTAVELYAEAFEQAGDFSNFENFMSCNGALFYGLPQNSGTLSLARNEWLVPDSLPYPDSSLIPFRAGETLHWKIVDGE